MKRPVVRWLPGKVALAPLLLAACDTLGVGQSAKIDVKPLEVIFRATTPRGDPYTEIVTVKNVGTQDLRVGPIALVGDAQFEAAWPEQSFTLRPQQKKELPVNYYSIDRQVRRAELHIQSNDPTRQKVIVRISTEDIAPRILVTDCVLPASGSGCQAPIDDLVVNFGDVRAGQCKTGQVIVENLGAYPLEVQAPSFQGGSSPDIQFDGAPPGNFSVNPIDQNGITDRRVINVKYCPMSGTGARATMVLSSNDPNNAVVLVELRGGALTNNPPACVCNPPTIEVAPQTPVNLGQACQATDPDGQPLQYAWTVVSRPPGSTEPIVNPNSQNASITVNTATTAATPYVFRLTVTDTWGASDSCEVTVFATPRDALHVQLVWDKDRTDVDLHLLNPVGAANPWGSTGWFHGTNDCYFANLRPEWGVVGDTTDNPRLDLDDTEGFGPENINLSRPQSGSFRVGVHYYCDDGLGASRATVRIFCNGTLAFETAPPMNLPTTAFFWEVATIQWPGCTITPLNLTRQLSGLPPQGGCTGFFGP